MVKDAQVGVLRRKRMEGKTQEASAGAAGMSVRSARKWEHGLYPSQRRKPHTWRKREDPFAELFDTEVAALLVEDRNGGWKRSRFWPSLIVAIRAGSAPGSCARCSAGSGNGGA